MRRTLSARAVIALAILSATAALAGAAVLSLRVTLAGASAPGAEIVVSANVRVSLDGDFAHIETPVAASPIGPNVLIAGATVFPPGDRAHDRAYLSNDRGASWRTVEFPALPKHGSGDPMVEVGPTGTLHFVTLDYGRDVATAYRSADTGRTWEGPIELGRMDRETIAVDRSAGRFAGQVYVAGTARVKDTTGVSVYYSNDDGRTYRQGGRACVNGPSVWLATLSDGTLLATCGEGGTLGFASSTDGGRTFTAYRPIARQARISERALRPLLAADAVLVPSAHTTVAPCAADVRGTIYRDRIYCVWEQPDSGTLTSRIYLTHSGDKGATWVRPRPVDTAAPAWATQAMPSVAVNGDGILGVAWLDTRISRTRDRYDVYFTASRDGADTFLPPVRVSSASSFPMGQGNLRPAVWSPIGSDTTHIMSSPFAMRPAGGDYAGMAADAAGEFHPVWPDARSGTWQVYSTRIRVARAGESLVRGLPAPAERVRASLTGRASVRIESSAIDASTLEMTFWARIRNVSADTLYGPFAVELTPRRPWLEALKYQRSAVPTATNASSKKSEIAMRFDYDGAAGTLDLLPPGGVTEARPWRFRAGAPRLTEFQMETTVTGFVRKPLAER